MTATPLSLKPGLYVTATPIGNLGDITYRAVETLRAADLILCEDTRQTAKLCAAYAIKTPRSVYHDHNGARARPAILEKLTSGARICLVSDAGTPLLADPGFKLVRDAIEAGVDIVPIPGPSALVAALSAGGVPTDRFTFGGFPPPKSAARRRFLEDFADAPGALVFFETGARIAASLADMASVFGDRPAVVARELTKMHETMYRDRLGALAASFAEHDVKGEIVILVHPAPDADLAPEKIDAFLRQALATMSVREAAAAAATSLSMPRREAYARALALKADL